MAPPQLHGLHLIRLVHASNMANEFDDKAKQEFEEKLIRKLTEEYFIFRRKAILQVFGAAFGAIVATVGISAATVLAYMRSEPAELARNRILAIGKEVEKKYADLGGVGTFVKTDSFYYLRNDAGAWNACAQHGAGGVNEAVVLTGSDNRGIGTSWQFVKK
jgi:hypothetical protein